MNRAYYKGVMGSWILEMLDFRGKITLYCGRSDNKPGGKIE